MVRNYYTIYDAVAGTYGDLMYCLSDDVAKREFINIIRKMHVNKDDFILYKVGTFDDETGNFEDDFDHIVSGKDVDVPNIEGLEEILYRLSCLEQKCTIDKKMLKV